MHGHHHHHSAHDASHRIGWAFFLNLAFTIIEFVGGLLTNSTAILADAVHDLGDSLSIGMAWLLDKLGGKDADERYTYGYRRFSLLGALLNAIILIVGSIWVLTEALPRLADPEMPHAEGMLGLAILGIAVNGYAAFKLSHGKTLNERVLNWHLIEDVLGWVAVFIVSVILLFVDWPILDPVLSIAFTLFILFNVAKSLFSTVNLFLQAAPSTKVREEACRRLREIEHVRDIHHLHFWSLDGEHHVLTTHLVLDAPVDQATQVRIKAKVAEVLAKFELSHTTVELEFPDESCRDGDQVPCVASESDQANG